VTFFLNGKLLTVCDGVDFTHKTYQLAILFCGNSECAEYMMGLLLLSLFYASAYLTDYQRNDRPPMCPMEPKVNVLDFLHDDAVKSRATNVNSLFQKIEIKKVKF
jgi:hypothetical protein